VLAGRRPQQRAQLCLEEIAVGSQREPNPALPEEGVCFLWKVEIRHVLVAADIQRSNNDPIVRKRFQRGRDRVVLFGLIGWPLTIQKQELATKEADPVGTAGDGRIEFRPAADVGGDLDLLPVSGRHRLLDDRGVNAAGGRPLVFVGIDNHAAALAVDKYVRTCFDFI